MDDFQSCAKNRQLKIEQHGSFIGRNSVIIQEINSVLYLITVPVINFFFNRGTGRGFIKRSHMHGDTNMLARVRFNGDVKSKFQGRIALIPCIHLFR